jgi:uncharacterized protein YqjF (DUF2071 family)
MPMTHEATAPSHRAVASTGPDLDRIGPGRRDACRTRPSGRQTWRDLLFVHWAVPERALRHLVPPALSIDTFEGAAYIGLVPFTMHDVRLGPLVVADFLEANLRTYVHAEGVPGVWFLSLDAASSLAVWGGRTFYGLPYFGATMSCAKDDGGWSYSAMRRGRKATLDLQWSLVDPSSRTASPGTLEHFLVERYALYGPTRRGGTYRVRVHHPPWPLHQARLERMSTNLLSAAGVERAGEPIDLVLASPVGVPVTTFAREPMRG